MSSSTMVSSLYNNTATRRGIKARNPVVATMKCRYRWVACNSSVCVLLIPLSRTPRAALQRNESAPRRLLMRCEEPPTQRRCLRRPSPSHPYRKHEHRLMGCRETDALQKIRSAASLRRSGRDRAGVAQSRTAERRGSRWRRPDTSLSAPRAARTRSSHPPSPHLVNHVAR
jgi:hypothetical protein